MSRYGSGLSKSEIYHEELSHEEQAASHRPGGRFGPPRSSYPTPQASQPMAAEPGDPWYGYEQPKKERRSDAFVSSQAANEAYARQQVAQNAQVGERRDAQRTSVDYNSALEQLAPTPGYPKRTGR